MQQWREAEEKNTVCKVRAKQTYFVWPAPHSASTSAGNRLKKRAKVGSKSSQYSTGSPGRYTATPSETTCYNDQKDDAPEKPSPWLEDNTL